MAKFKGRRRSKNITTKSSGLPSPVPPAPENRMSKSVDKFRLRQIIQQPDAPKNLPRSRPNKGFTRIPISRVVT